LSSNLTEQQCVVETEAVVVVVELHQANRFSVAITSISSSFALVVSSERWQVLLLCFAIVLQ